MAAPHRWSDDAACLGLDPDMFLSDNDATAAGDYATALEVCGRCPVTEHCLEFALRTGSPGVWGNTTEAQRRKLVTQ
jgi:WhiB family redox-sensing transcriptional regulator